MDAALDAAQFSALGKILQSVAKTTEHVCLQPLPQELRVIAVNGARSAFVLCRLERTLFERYRSGTDDEQIPASPGQPRQTPAAGLRVLLRPLLAIFRARTSTDAVERCILRAEADEGSRDRLVVQLRLARGITKVFRLHYEAFNPLLAVYDKQACPQRWVAPARLVRTWLQHFAGPLEQVAMFSADGRVHLRSFSDAIPRARRARTERALQTELRVGAEDFEQLDMADGAPALTFTLRELRGLLFLADGDDLAVAAHFEGRGRPIVFSVARPGSYSVDLLLATLTEADSDSE